MLRKWIFWCFFAFWVFMNAWLWRTEHGQTKETGDRASETVVGKRILTAPDHSVLAVEYRGKRIGFLRWTPNINEAGSAEKASEEEPVEGIVKQLSDYSIHIEGNLALQLTNRMTFNIHLRFDTNQMWQEITAKVSSRLGSIQLHTTSSSEQIQMEFFVEGSKWEQNISKSILRNPDKLLQEFGLPVGMLWPGSGLMPLAKTPDKNPGTITWSIFNDWWRVGHSNLRVYRAQLKIMNRYEINAIISRVGEILRVELPNDLVAVNEAFLSW
jgi:hypothetical protein